jgi:hypothetical protein
MLATPPPLSGGFLCHLDVGRQEVESEGDAQLGSGVPNQRRSSQSQSGQQPEEGARELEPVPQWGPLLQAEAKAEVLGEVGERVFLRS